MGKTIHDLWILVLMQLSDKIRIKRDQTPAQKLGVIGKLALKMGLSYGIFVGLFYVIFALFSLPTTESVFIFFIFVLQILSIIGCTSTMSNSLYLSKDNAILLTYPIKHVYVYISKLVVAYILELYRSLLFILPMFFAYFTTNYLVMFPFLTDIASYIVGAILFSILLPLFSTLIGSVLSIPLAYVQKAFKKYNILKIIGTILLITGLVFLTVWIIKILPPEIRIMELINTIKAQFLEILNGINIYSGYCQFIGRAMYGNNTFLNYLYAILILIGLVGLAILTSLPLFFKLASSSSENSINKKHAGKNIMHKSEFITFTRKELILSIRNIGDFISDYLFLFIMPFLLPVMATIFIRINRNINGIMMTYAFIGLIVLVLLSASSTASATAISSEGNEFVLLKTAPSKTSKIIWSKLLMNFVISTFMVTITFIILSIILRNESSKGLLWIIFVAVLIVNLGLLCWSIQLDIVHPRLKEYASSHKRSDVKNFSSSIGIGLLISIIFSLIIIVLSILKLDFVTISIILIGLALLFTGIRFYFLVNYSKAYFDDIQV